MNCPCNSHNPECGKNVNGTGLLCHLDKNHQGDCVLFILPRPTPEQLTGDARKAHLEAP